MKRPLLPGQPGPASGGKRKNLLPSFYALLFRHRVLVITIWLGLIVLAACMTFSLKPDTGNAAFFPDSSSEAAAMVRDMDVPPFSRLLFIDLSTSGGSSPEQLAAAADAIVQALPADLAVRAGADPQLSTPEAFLSLLPSTSAWNLRELEGLAGPDVIRKTVRDIRHRLEGLWVPIRWVQADPFSLLSALNRLVPAQGAFPTQDPVLGYPFDASRTHLLLIVRPIHDMRDIEQAGRLMDVLHAALQNLPPDMTARIVGGHRHSAENARTIFHDIDRIVLLSLIGFAAVYLLLVRSPAALWILAAPAIAALLAGAGMSLVWANASGLALGFGASVLGLAEDYAVHVHFALRGNEPPRSVLPRLTSPLVQALLMNCIGFSVLLFSGIPAVRQLAGFAMMTLVGGLLAALCLLPLLPWHRRVFFSPPVKTGPQQCRVPDLKKVIPCVGILLAVCAAGFSRVPVDVSPRTLGANMAAMEADAAALEQVWGGAMHSTAFVVHGQTPDAALEQAAALAGYLRAQDDGTVLTITDLLPPRKDAEQRVAEWNRWARETEPLLRERLVGIAREEGFSATAFEPFLAWLATPQQPGTPDSLRRAGLGELADTFIRTDGGETRVLVLARTPSAAGLARNGIGNAEVPALRNVVVLSPERLESTLRQAFVSERHLLPAVIILCSAMLFVLLRKIPPFLLVAVPPLSSLAAVLCWMMLSHRPLTLASIAALPLMVSLAIDHGLIMTHDLMHGTSFGVERAMTVSTLTSIMGMGMLALADHPALHDMGCIILIGLLVEWGTAHCLLPRLCSRLEP